MSRISSKRQAPQAAFAKKAIVLKAAATPRAPPSLRLLDKGEVCRIANVTFPTIWSWMRAGTFPRSRVVGGKSMWLLSEVEAWLAALPVRALKGDDQPSEVA